MADTTLSRGVTHPNAQSAVSRDPLSLPRLLAPIKATVAMLDNAHSYHTPTTRYECIGDMVSIDYLTDRFLSSSFEASPKSPLPSLCIINPNRYLNYAKNSNPTHIPTQNIDVIEYLYGEPPTHIFMYSLPIFSPPAQSKLAGCCLYDCLRLSLVPQSTYAPPIMFFFPPQPATARKWMRKKARGKELLDTTYAQ